MNFLNIAVTDSIFDLPLALRSMGHSVTVLDQYAFHPNDLDQAAPLSAVEDALCRDSFDYVITYHFVPVISNLCQKKQVPYIAWIYDSPLLAIFHESVFNSVNRIFVFDSAFYDRLVQIGIPHVYYMPLAVNSDRLDSMIFTPEDQQQFSKDISFVGSLYENNAYNDLKHKLPLEIVTPMNHYLMKNLCNWHSKRPWPSLPQTCVSYVTGPGFPSDGFCKQFQMPETMYYGILFLSRKLAEMERITSLVTLAEDFPVDLYTASTSSEIGILHVHEPVNYYIDLGKVYHFSRINLNFTLPSIETGVPLRVFDIMGCGGFVMTNYQKDMEQLFDIGKDLVVFHDLPELKELCAYYLSHDKERLEIAARGQQTVKERYSYQAQLTKILSICATL